jgi:holo-[acyl-carrier protein] synthase
MTVIGLGTDIVEIDRVRAALQAQPRLAARLFTPEERAYCDRRADPAPHYAARFAAKEAVAKAVGRHLHWQEVSITSGSQGQPGLVLTGDSARWAGVTRGASFLLSLSHSRDYATATVLLLAPPGPGQDEFSPRVRV